MTFEYLLPLLLTVMCCTRVPAQNEVPLRYFQFRIECGHGNWQDTAVVAATRDTHLIAAFQTQLDKPFDERQFINGPIAHGDGGHNHNADHRFKWHFLPDEWELVDLAIEVCSGCPFSDLDTDPVYWVDTLGLFCPWSARPVREIEEPLTSTRPDPVTSLPFAAYPNPAGTYLTVDLAAAEHAVLRLRDALGRTPVHVPIYGLGNRIDVAHLPRGLYFLELSGSRGRRSIRQIFLQ